MITKKVSKNKDTIIKLILLLIMILLCNFLPITVINIKDTLLENKYKNIAEILIEKIKEEKNNKYIYMYDDLSKYFEKLGNKGIKENSYISYYYNKIYICLSDGKNKLEGYDNDLKLKTVNSFNKDCNYYFAYIYDFDTDTYKSEGETYLKYYLEAKYKIQISSVKINYECGLFDCKTIDYTVTTPTVSFKANAEVINNKIVVTDNYYEALKNSEN